MKTKLLTITLFIALVLNFASCSETAKDLVDCAYQSDEEACGRLEDAESSLESTLYQTPDSVQVNVKKLPSLD